MAQDYVTYEFERFNNGYDFAKGYQNEGYEILDKNRQKSGYEILRAGPGTWFVYQPGNLPIIGGAHEPELIGKGSLVDEFLLNWTTLPSRWVSQLQLPEEEEEWSAQVCGNTLTIQSSFATPTQVLSCIIRGFLLIHFKI